MNYVVTGSILLESTREEASYEFEMESEGCPSEMEILHYMMQTGEIQILHGATEEVTA